jgi:hypothetical protein
MKTNFKLLWPWFRWKNEAEDNATFKGVGFPTEISYHEMFGEWHFEVQIFGFGFHIERFPIGENKKQKTKTKTRRRH